MDLPQWLSNAFNVGKDSKVLPIRWSAHLKNIVTNSSGVSVVDVEDFFLIIPEVIFGG